MAITWSGGADFSIGPFAPGSSWSVDSLVVPSGNAPSAGAVLLTAIAIKQSPGQSGVPQFATGFVDSGSTLNASNPATFRGAFDDGIQVVILESHNLAASLNGGGKFQFSGLVSGTAGSVAVSFTGTIVAAIWDGGGALDYDHTYNPGNVGALTSPQSGTESFPGTGDQELLFFGLCCGICAGAASTPSFISGIADWSDVVTRTNGTMFAGVGLFTGTLPVPDLPGLSWRQTFTNGDWAAAIASGLFQPGIAARSRSFGTILG